MLVEYERHTSRRQLVITKEFPDGIRRCISQLQVQARSSGGA